MELLKADSLCKSFGGLAATCICAVLALAAIWSMMAKTIFSMSLPRL